MTQEQEKTKKALETAIQMEIDGKQFYKKAASASNNSMGKKLLSKLAEEEDIHRKVFENIFNTLSENKGWPKAEVHPTGVKTILSDLKDEVSGKTKPLPEEIDAVQAAMNMENKTFDFYRSHAQKASYPAEKEFYNDLAMQEEEHHKVLLNYYEFLKDPEAWFVQMEHPSLDGG